MQSERKANKVLLHSFGDHMYIWASQDALAPFEVADGEAASVQQRDAERRDDAMEQRIASISSEREREMERLARKYDRLELDARLQREGGAALGVGRGRGFGGSFRKQ